MKAALVPEDESRAIVPGPAGELDLGIIDEAAALAAKTNAGPIRLQWGYPGAKGFGLEHVKTTPGRVPMILRHGFATPQDYAFQVASNWNALYGGPGPNKVTAAWHTRAMAFQIALRWEQKGFWSITTMLPFVRVNYPRLYEK